MPDEIDKLLRRSALAPHVPTHVLAFADLDLGNDFSRNERDGFCQGNDIVFHGFADLPWRISNL